MQFGWVGWSLGLGSMKLKCRLADWRVSDATFKTHPKALLGKQVLLLIGAGPGGCMATPCPCGERERESCRAGVCTTKTGEEAGPMSTNGYSPRRLRASPLPP